MVLSAVVFVMLLVIAALITAHNLITACVDLAIRLRHIRGSRVPRLLPKFWICYKGTKTPARRIFRMRASESMQSTLSNYRRVRPLEWQLPVVMAKAVKHPVIWVDRGRPPGKCRASLCGKPLNLACGRPVGYVESSRPTRSDLAEQTLLFILATPLTVSNVTASTIRPHDSSHTLFRNVLIRGWALRVMESRSVLS